MKNTLSFLALIAFGSLSAQGLIQASQNIAPLSLDNSSPLVQCGSHKHMEHIDRNHKGFLDDSNNFMKNLSEYVSSNKSKRSSAGVLTVPVVFHVVYNSPDENLADSVLLNQINVLNENFRRQNADTVNMRSAFNKLVGDTKIQFELAKTDPSGNPTTGITRTSTSISHFGGILPYAQNQTQQIQTWVADSLFYNLFRITSDSLGGKDAWDIDEYFNIWIGDLRIFEPKLNNFEELFLFGLATPPANHPNWTPVAASLPDYEQGSIMHYVSIGANNPNDYPSPYNVYNTLVKDGELLVHEAGHYLGLRHIWGDGPCSSDDFIADTPPAASSSQFDCNKIKNTCVDTIGGVNLPDMVENFMDYSSNGCMNSFTKGQADIMTAVLLNYRSQLYSIGINEEIALSDISCYPNPSNSWINIDIDKNFKEAEVKVYSFDGALIDQLISLDNNTIKYQLKGPVGIYLVHVNVNNTSRVFKVLKN